MKILLIEPLGDGGIAHYTFNLANSLAAEKCKVFLFTTFLYELGNRIHHFECSQSMFRLAFKIIYKFPFLAKEYGISNIIRKFLKIIEYPINVLEIIRYAKKGRIFIVHVQSINEIELFLVFALRCTGFHLILTVHNVFPRHGHLLFYHKYLYRFMYHLCHHIIVHTQSGKKQLVRLFLVDEDKISVIPHGNYDFFLPASKESVKSAREKLGLRVSDKVVLFFGAIRPNKGLETLLLAISLLKKHDDSIKLLIAGEPCENFDRYSNIINRENLDNAVLAKLEYIRIDDVALYFSASDLVALPYHEVTGSGVLQIAYAFGKPVVATNLEGFRESVVDGKNGYLVPDHDPLSLAKSIQQILSDDHIRKQMGYFSHNLSQSIYSWQNIAKATKSIYEKVEV